MRNYTAYLCALALAYSGSALAAPFDGSKPLICATLEVNHCSAGESCEKQTIDVADAPRFISISVADKKITGTRPSGGTVEAAIESVHHSQDMMFLLGAQEAFAWNIAIGESDGKMTVTLSDNDDGIVIFGACAVR
jgi:hypothetical protein